MRTWTDAEEKLLAEKYATTSQEELCRLFNKSSDGIKCKAQLLGLRKATGFHGKGNWTAWDIRILEILYPDTDIETIQFVLDRSKTAVYARAQAMGFKRSEAYMEKMMLEITKKLEISGRSHRFRKDDGKTGWNKGMKQAEFMSAESIERSASTRFKKGQDPANTQDIGYTRLSKDGYLEIKVRHDKKNSSENFEFMHRVIWEKANGPIPEDMIIEFADGNKQNLDIENLVLTTRKQNVRQNTLRDPSIVKRFFKIKDPEMVKKVIQEFPAIIELKKKNIILNWKINDKGKN